MIKKRFSSILLIFSFFLLAYTIFKSEIIFSGNFRDYYIDYYIGSCCLILFSLLSFIFNAKLQNFLIKILLLGLLLSYLGEYFLYSTNQFSYKIHKPFKKKEGKDLAYSSIVNNEINKSVVYPNKLFLKNNKKQIFPLSGVSNVKTVFCKNEENFSFFYSDRYGFNNPDFVWNKLSTDFLLIGDLVALGACENRPYDLASQLRLFNKDVVTIGYHENESLMMLASLKEYIPKNTKNVFWLYYEANDTDEIEIELNDNILSKYFYDKDFSQNLRDKQNKINELVKEANYQLYRKNHYNLKSEFNKTSLSLLKFIKLSNLRFFFFKKEIKSQKEILLPHPYFKEIIRKAKEFTLKRDANFYFVYIPKYKKFEYETNLKEFNNIKSIINNLDISFIDVNAEIFSKLKDPKQYYNKGEFKTFNRKAYKAIAGVLIKYQ